ncbi:hypothetical protein [Marinifilum caeruleilacunae]|uniref:Uncharacterized protein n=1 Tax=Marinifilum caeruleilacunae TaxID=2499076 RepID=A0ABX1WTR4_9BACT|nr:hypothetical protein [Marinifilum caeruleilacunae]NOU59500.1 hypothetical protein [Marinifilum caeruleilacunae]
MLGIKFSLASHFEFVDYWFKLIPLPIIDISGISDEVYPDTKMIGYSIYLLSSFILFFKLKTDRILLSALLIFFSISAFAITFEVYSIFQYINSSYEGQTLYIGPFLFLFNFAIIRSYPKRLELKKYAL